MVAKIISHNDPTKNKNDKKKELGIGVIPEKIALPIKINSALSDFYKAIELGHDEIELRYNISAIYYKFGHFEEAEKEYEKVLKLPDKELEEETYHLKACSNLIRIKLSFGKCEEALELCDKIIQIDPNIKGAHDVKAKILSTMGKNEEAVKEWNLLLT